MRLPALVALLFLNLAACTSAPEAMPPGAPIPLDTVPYVYASDAEIKTTISLAEARWEKIIEQWGTPTDALAERESIARVIALMERAAGEQTPTWQDRPRSVPVFGARGQLDCISESTNTTTFLMLLAQHALLTRHDIMHPQFRHQAIIFDPHRTAIIRDRASGACFAVDSWDGFSGDPPTIQALDAWRRKDPVPSPQTPPP